MGNPKETRSSRPARVGTAGRLVLAAGLTLGGFTGVSEIFSAQAAGKTGDVNCDGRTNSIDAALELQRVAGLTGQLPCESEGDVNNDHLLNAVDAALMLQQDAGIIRQKPTAADTPTRTTTRTPTRTPTNPPTETQTPIPTPEPTPAFQEGPNYELAQGITVLINQERQRLELNQLTLDPAIVSAANEYAQFLFDNPSLGFDHNLDGLDPGQRAKKYGYQ